MSLKSITSVYLPSDECHFWHSAISVVSKGKKKKNFMRGHHSLKLFKFGHIVLGAFPCAQDSTVPTCVG